MSYLVFARKWRPQKFDDVVGQEHITQPLKNSVLNSRLAHAYLFVGPRGVGKTSCARILAKSLNCKNAPTVNPCGECSACQEISEGRSLDVIEIDGASNRGIDEIRTLRENVKFSPVLGKYKIYIIDEVHQITHDGFNALLKTLEEPPEHVKFIFATTRPDKIMATILSRCQRFEFKRIPTLKIISKLEEICKAEKISIDKDVLFNIAKISDGSMRDAESVLDQLVSFSKDKIRAADVIEVMGLIGQEAYFVFLEAVKNKDTQFCIDFIAKLFSSGKNIANFLDGFLWHLRNLMLAKIMKSNLEELLDLPEDVAKKVLEQAHKLSLGEIITLFTAVTQTQDMSKKIGSFRIPLEVMIVKLTQPLNLETEPASVLAVPEKKISAKIKLDNIGSLFIGPKRIDLNMEDKAKVAQEPNNNNVDIKDPVKLVKDAPQVDFKTILNNWNRVIEVVSQRKISVGTYLKDSVPLNLENGVLAVGFPKKSVFYKEAVEQKQNQKVIVDVVSALFNVMLSLKFQLVENLGVESDAKDSDKSYLKSVLDTFKGRLFEKD